MLFCSLCFKKRVYLCPVRPIKKICIMAKPIAETPILYDEDAYRFEIAAHNVVPLPQDVRDAIRKNYEEVKKWCEIEEER